MFTTGREAKEFLVSKIIAEAAREGVPLSEVERKMMYFSETAWTLPDMMEVNTVFDREYDCSEYERKISKLAEGFRAEAKRNKSPEQSHWDEAVRILKQEDHYLLVLIEGEKTRAVGGASSGSWVRLFVIGVAIACVLYATCYLLLRLGVFGR